MAGKYMGIKGYSIGDICSLLDMRPHIIRYWEKVFPFLKPKKSLSGRRLYTEREVQLLFRIKYLLDKKKCSIETAIRKIWDEIDADKIELKLHVQELRGELLDLLRKLPIKKTMKSGHKNR